MNEQIKRENVLCALINIKNMNEHQKEMFGLDMSKHINTIEIALNQAEKMKKEIKLLQEYNFDYVMELNLLREFAEIVIKNIVISKNTTMSDDITFGCGFYNEIIHKNEFSVIKEVVEKYEKK